MKTTRRQFPYFLVRQPVLALAGSVAVLLTAQSAQSATSTWDASPASAAWNATNWTGTDNPPVSGDALVFGASTQTTLTNDLTTGAAWIIPSITFSAGAPAYVISGNGFTLGTSTNGTILSNAGTSLQTINNDINFGAAWQTIALTAGGGDITLGGAVTGTGAGTEIFTSGSGTLTIKGATTLNGLNVRSTAAVKVDGGNLSVDHLGNQLSGGTVQVTNGGSFYAKQLYTSDHYIVQDSGTVTLGASSGDLIQQPFYTMTGGTASVAGTIYNGLNLDASGTANITFLPAQSMTSGGTASGTLSLRDSAAVIFANGLNLAASSGNGTVNLNGGTLNVASLSKTSSTAAAAMNFNGGKLQFSAGTTVSAMTGVTFNVLSGGAAIDTQANNVTIAQPLVSGTANDGGISKYGTGNLTLSGPNTFNGNTVINSGTLTLAHNYALQGSTLNYDNQGGVLSFGSLSGNVYIGGLKGSQNLALNSSNSETIYVGGNNQDATYSGILSGTNGLYKIGTGTWTLTGANTFTSSPYINGGVLSISSASNLGAGSVVNLGGGTLQVTGATAVSLASKSVVLNSGTSSIDVSNSAGVTLGVVTGGGQLNKTGVGTLTLGSANNTYTWTGAVLVQQGTLLLDNASALAGTFDTSGAGNLSFGSLSGVVTFGGLIGTGTLAIPTGVTLRAGASSYAGSLTGAGGFTVMAASSGNKLAVFTGTSSIAGQFTINTGCTMEVNGGSFTAGTLNTSGTIKITNGGRLTIGTQMWGTTQNYVLQDSGYFSVGTGSGDLDQYLYLTITGGTAALNGNMYEGLNTDASGSAVVNIARSVQLVNYSATNNGYLNIGGNAAVTINGTLDFANTTASGTVNLNGGVLTLAGFQKSNTTSVTTVNLNGGKLKLAGSTIIASTANTAFNVLAGGAVIDTQGYNVSLAQALISGTAMDGGLKKAGTGNLTLNGVNTYTGATTISSGTLTLGAAGSIANSSTIVVGDTGSTGTVLDLTAKSSYIFLSGQTLKGIGNLNIGSGKTITVNSGAHWAPGNSIGANSVTGNLALAGVADIELGTANALAASSVNDQTAVNGTLGLDGTLNLIDNAGANGQGVAGAGQYKIFTGFTGTASGSFSSVNNISGYHAKVDTATAGAVYVNNYQIAASNTLTPTVNLGITHVGQGFTNSTLSIQNTAASNGYAEGLNAIKGATTGAATLGGSDISNLAGGSTSTAITVGLNDTATAGAKTGTATVGFASNGTVSGYGDTALGNQTVTVNGQVNYYADPTFTQGSGGVLTTIDATHVTLDLGAFDKDTGIYTATITLDNFLHDATYQDLLAGGFDVSGAGAFSLSGFDATLASIASGSGVILTVSFDTTGVTAGNYTGTVLFNPTSVNTSGTESLNTVNLGLTFEVTQVPEPATWSMFVGGLGVMAFLQRARRRSSL